MSKNTVSDVAEILDRADEYADATKAIIELVDGMRGKFPVQEAADLIRKLVTEEFKPLILLVTDAVRGAISRDAHFQAALLKEIRGTYNISEETAHSIVSKGAQNLDRAISDSIARANEKLTNKS